MLPIQRAASTYLGKYAQNTKEMCKTNDLF